LDLYQHFGLTGTPFGATPELDSFYAAPLHQEALATLQFAARTNKGCVVLVGDSGLGKTLIAQLATRTRLPRQSVLWIAGVGQPADVTEVAVFADGAHPGGTVPPSVGQLGDWCHGPQRPGPAPLLVIDEADELKPHNWTDILSLFAQEMRFGQPVNVFLLGLHQLRERLAQNELARLRRRIFRICPLRPLNVDQTRDYLACRLRAAGGHVDAIFAPEAVQEIGQLTRGNPGLINQLCDNALIEAYGAERRQVTPQDVLAAVSAMVGISGSEPVTNQIEPTTTDWPPAPPQPPAVPARPPRPARPAQLPPPPSSQLIVKRIRTMQHRLRDAMRMLRTSTAVLDSPADVPEVAVIVES